MEQIHFGNFFATPVVSQMLTDGAALNAQLRASILEHERTHPGVELTNFGGWHSETGRLEFCGAAGERLIRHIHEMIGETTRQLFASFTRPLTPMNWTFSAWANVNRKGHFNQVHTHPGATWSAVYYIDHGEADDMVEGTALHLYDPNSARTNLFYPELSAQDVLFRPTPGLMVLFPSYVPHAVLPHQGERERISIAFNVRREPFP